MARIPMTSGFTLIPEGEYIFRIEDVKYNESFGTIDVKLITKNGLKYTEHFSLMDKNGEANEKAMNAFSYFSKTALNNFDLTDIEHTDLIGHYIRATVIHTKMPSRKDPTKTMTFANLDRDKYPATGFDTDVPTTNVNTSQSVVKEATNGVDLDSLLS